MEYQKIRELQDWPRREAFDHFYHQVVTAVTLTADVDVAPLLRACHDKQPYPCGKIRTDCTQLYQ